MESIVIRLKRKLKGCVFVLLLSCFFLTGCDRGGSPTAIVWEGEKAVAIVIPKSAIGSADINAIQVQLVKADERGPVLGEFKIDGANVMFTPLVPLTRGLAYEIFLKGKLIGGVAIPASTAAPPELISIYPTNDTVPENLLKIYFQFSAPMEEGSSLKNVTLLRNSRDTMRGTFLDLSPELWNNDGTMLTLWLDPGRIKRDLTPNKEFGNPLEPLTHYSLHVSQRWRSKDGIEMESEYVKNFMTRGRDDLMPVPDKWNFEIPAPGTSNPLNIYLRESLDYSLLNDAIQIRDSNHNVVEGNLVVGSEEKSIAFIPDDEWRPGQYSVQIETRLEDLAGNNINRPFDRDIKKHKAVEEKEMLERPFVIR